MARPAASAQIEAIRSRDEGASFDLASELAREYRAGVDERPVFPTEEALEGLAAFDEELPGRPTDTSEVLRMLHQHGSPATVAQTGGRYFGFVCGGLLPVSLAARWLTDAWDQNAALYVLSPTCSKIEEVAERWIVDLLGLPAETAAGFVSGSSTASIMGLATGRNMLLQRAGHDVFAQGLFDAPPVRVVVGEGAHSTVFKALSIIGMGNQRVVTVPADDMGCMRVDGIPELDDRTLLILQAGHVNTGGFDDFRTICSRARDSGAYVHVDGAFGLWAAASPRLQHWTDGVALADSWSVDGHKTLNTPYDNGVLLCRHRDMLVKSMHMTGSYIVLSEDRDGMMFTPEMSRRARAVDIWATLKGLGRRGVAELVDELHRKARYFADLLSDGGLEIVNDVVFNQVLVHFQSDERTTALIQAVQESRVCWLGGARMNGRAVMRISVSSYRTTLEDIEASAADILRLAASMK